MPKEDFFEDDILLILFLFISLRSNDMTQLLYVLSAGLAVVNCVNA